MGWQIKQKPLQLDGEGEKNLELEKNAVFQRWLKDAVEAYGDKMHGTKKWDDEKNDDYEFGTQVTTFFNFNGKYEELIFGTLVKNDDQNEVPVRIWFNIDDDEEGSKRISESLEKKLSEMYENQQSAHGIYLDKLDKFPDNANFCFILNKQSYEKLCADDVCPCVKQEILTQFFKEVMDIVLQTSA